MERLLRNPHCVLTLAARPGGKPPRLRLPGPAEVAERDRAEFDRAVREDAFGAPADRGPEAPASPAALLRKLQRGRLVVRAESEISLRQKTRDEARRLLESFLRARRMAGDRFVKVIHGKGYRSSEGRPVLARRVPEWLAGWRPELVAAWGETRRDDGGSGALYVALARPPSRTPAREPKSTSTATSRTRSSRSTHSSGP